MYYDVIGITDYTDILRNLAKNPKRFFPKYSNHEIHSAFRNAPFAGDMPNERRLRAECYGSFEIACAIFYQQYNSEILGYYAEYFMTEVNKRLGKLSKKRRAAFIREASYTRFGPDFEASWPRSLKCAAYERALADKPFWRDILLAQFSESAKQYFYRCKYGGDVPFGAFGGLTVPPVPSNDLEWSGLFFSAALALAHIYTVFPCRAVQQFAEHQGYLYVQDILAKLGFIKKPAVEV
jgi:hypothetical protein